MTKSESTISPFQYNPGSSSKVVTYLQGIKGGETNNSYLLVGANNSSGPNPVGLVYQGPLDAVQSNGVSGSGRWSIVSIPERKRSVIRAIHCVAAHAADAHHSDCGVCCVHN